MKTARRLTAMLLALVLALALVPAAFADYGPSASDIYAVGDEKNIEMPKQKSYLDDYETKVVKSGKGHSIYVFYDTTAAVSHTRPWYAYEGDTVTVIARQGNLSCILFVNDRDTLKAGWVNSQFLADC